MGSIGSNLTDNSSPFSLSALGERKNQIERRVDAAERTIIRGDNASKSLDRAEKQVNELLQDINIAPDDEQIYKRETTQKTTAMENLSNEAYELLNRVRRLKERNNHNHPNPNNYRS